MSLTIFLHNHIHKDGENRARVFRVTKRVAINLYRELAYQERCCDRAHGYRLFYHELYMPYPLYNNARDGITTDCSRYPLAIIRMQTDVTAAFVCLVRQTILNDVLPLSTLLSLLFSISLLSFHFSLLFSLSLSFSPLFIFSLFYSFFFLFYKNNTNLHELINNKK